MKTDKHIWRTATGKHVEAGHADAAVLAYAPGDDVPDHVLDELKAATKAKSAPADKSRQPVADKAAQDGSRV